MSQLEDERDALADALGRVRENMRLIAEDAHQSKLMYERAVAERDEALQRAGANEMAMEMCGEIRRILRDEGGYENQPAFLCDAVKVVIHDRDQARRERDAAYRGAQRNYERAKKAETERDRLEGMMP